jgi:hypothetical protein
MAIIFSLRSQVLARAASTIITVTVRVNSTLFVC